MPESEEGRRKSWQSWEGKEDIPGLGKRSLHIAKWHSVTLQLQMRAGFKAMDMSFAFWSGPAHLTAHPV